MLKPGPSRRWLALLSLSLLAATGCGPSLQVTPGQPTAELSGTWTADTAAYAALTEQLRQQLTAIDAQREQKQRRQQGVEPEDADPESPLHAGRATQREWETRDDALRREALLNFSLPGQTLHIAQPDPHTVMLQTQQNGLRRMDTLQGSTVVNTLGTLEVRSGWQGETFVIYSRDAAAGLTLLERYQRRADQLQVQLILRVPGLKNHRIDLRYQRG